MPKEEEEETVGGCVTHIYPVSWHSLLAGIWLQVPCINKEIKLMSGIKWVFSMMHYCVNIDWCALSGGVISYLHIDWPAAAPACWEQHRRLQLKPFPRKQEARPRLGRTNDIITQTQKALFAWPFQKYIESPISLFIPPRIYYFVSLMSILEGCSPLASQRHARRHRDAWKNKALKE